jgi:non-heme chloroperoxidase
MRFADVRLATGLRLHYAEHGDGTGDPVVFLHGWPDSWFSFSMVAERMPAQYRSLLLDQRGFGDSDRPANGYEIRDLAADVDAFLAALGIDKAAIVGHSMGSFVARRAAIAYPARVERLVLIGSGWLGSNDVTREVHASLKDLPDPVPREFARDFQASTAFAPVPEAFFDRIVTESLKLPARLWAELLGGVIRYDDRSEVGGVSVETLLLWGERDALFSRDDQDRLVAALPRATLRTYSEIGHCPNWECPDEVARDLVTFFRRDHTKSV